MAVGSVDAVIEPELGMKSIVPVSPVTGWVDICTAPETQDADPTTDPNSITVTTQNWMRSFGLGTTLMIRLKYDDGISSVTSPIVQPFGRTNTSTVGADSKGLCHRLVNSSGTHELTLTVDLTNDVSDGTFNYTNPVEVDMDGSYEVFVAINTALSATGTVNTSTIQVKVK